MRQILCVFVPFVVIVAACGGSDTAESPTTTSATATSAPATAPAPTSVAATAPPTSQAPASEPRVAVPTDVVVAEGGDGIRQPLATAPLPEGWSEEEFLFGGEATSYLATTELGADGVWGVEPDSTAPYRTRMIVRRPPAEVFSGVVIVEWFNVTAGTDTSPDWGYLAEEIERSGHSYVGVSVQEIGVNGAGPSRAGGLVDTSGLKAVDAARYGTLEHPGDGYSFDIMSQAGAVVGGLTEVDVLGGLEPTMLLAAGESQSAMFLSTYINAFHPITGLFDGFLVHSRGAVAPAPTGDRETVADVAFIRQDIGVPVFQYEAETDLTALEFAKARQSDSRWVHTWEVAGTAHSDAYALAVSAGSKRDAGLGSIIGCEVGINDGPHHETLQAAVSHLVTWVRDGVTPPTSPLIELDNSGDTPVVARDADGIALGGIRTPPVDAPLRVLSGQPGADDGSFCFLFGKTLPLGGASVVDRYGDVDGYMAAFDAAAETALAQGWLLEADVATMRSEEFERATELFDLA